MRTVTRDEWIDALESGRYSQTKGYLHVRRPMFDLSTPVGFCCLGVLCDLAGVPENEENILEASAYQFPGKDAEFLGLFSEWTALIPPWFLNETLALPEMDPRRVSVISNTLTQMNDSGRSFAEIAQYLRSLPRASA